MRYFNEIDTVTADDGTPFRVVIELDQESSDLDPRHNDVSSGVIVALPPDSRHWAPQEDAGTVTAAEILTAVGNHSFQTVARWLRIFHGAGVVLPLYSGSDALTTGDPDDTARAGDYYGVTFDTPQTREECGWPEKVEYSTTREHLRSALETDVNEWATWARGDVFGYIVQRGSWDEDDEIVWDEDSNEEAAWGHIGEDWARESARVGLDGFIRMYNTDRPDLSDEDESLRVAEMGT